MKPILFALTFFLALTLFPILANAQVNETVITFADLNIVKGIHILIYNQTGEFIGEFGTTDSTGLPSGSYVFILKPTEQSWFSDPINAITLFTIWLPPMMSYLLWLVVIMGTVFMVTRLWK